MPAIRSGFGSDFVLKNEKIGIGSTTPTSVFDVAGAIKGDFAITGVATLTSYGGFVAQNQHINKASSIGFATVGLQTGAGIITSVQYYETETGFTDLGGVHHGDDQYFNTLSEDLIIDDGQILNITNTDMVGVTTIGEYDPHSHESYVCAGSLEQVSVTDHFSAPSGGINDRKDNPIEGTVRFNTDLNTLEFFNGNEWRQFNYNQGQSGRAVFGGGYAPAMTNMIEYIQTSTLGNAIDFGILTESGAMKTAMSSNTRGLFSGGGTPAYTNTIDYITIASAGNAIDFGDGTTTASWGRNGLSSSTRGLMGAGYVAQNIIDYVQIHTLGNALDFGDLTIAKHSCHGLSSPTRGLWGGGNNGGTNYNMIDSVIISSKGDAIDFGTLIERRTSMAGFSSPTRGIWLGGNNPIAMIGSIEYVTIASGGNAQYFGEATVAAQYKRGNSSNTRGVNNGGRSPTITDIIEYVTIATAGNALDFGDLSKPRDAMGVASDSHGGLGGF